MGLDVRVAARAEDLLPELLAWLDAGDGDPLRSDLVVVPNVGVRSWLGTAIADRGGILAGVTFAFPAELRLRLLGLPAPAQDPWRPERVAWRVLAALTGPDAPLELPWAGAPARPWSIARRVADLLDRYDVQRPELIAAWARGGVGGWQADVWRQVRAAIGVPSGAERLLARAEAGVRAGAGVEGGPGLPPRFAVVGIADLAPATADVLRLAAEGRDVLVLAPIASPTLLDRVEARPTVNQLLAGWGRPAAAAADVLTGLGAVAVTTDTDVPDAVGSSQLMRLRADVVADRVTSGVDAAVRADGRGGDASVQVHACHGLVRQLEVLRDALLHAFEDLDGLRPRDVLVLCPDLGRVAPLVGPILGAEVAGQRLPVRVADRSALAPALVPAALDAVLDVAAGRAERDEVLALLALPVVRTALGLEEEDLELLARAADELDLRWGVDAAHRRRWGYPDGVAAGTWREGVDRLLVGALLHPDDVVVAGLAPATDVRAQDLPALGRLAGAVAALGELVDLAAEPRPMAAWEPLLLAVVGRWLRPPRPDGDAQYDQALGAARVEAAVRALAADAAAAGADVPLDLLEVRTALADRLAPTGGGVDPRGGAITVASLAPLRGVPARVVAVVDAGALTAPAPPDADDLVAATPSPGERDRRDEPRAALLDAVLAARDRLLLTCDGQDVRTGAVQPLPTAVEELLDALPDIGGDAPLVVRHPRHLADTRNLGADVALGRLTDGRPWTFLPSALRAAAALVGADRRTGGLRDAVAAGPAPRVAIGSDGTTPTVLTLAALQQALAQPARAWLRHGLGLRLPPDVELPPRALPVWLGRRDDGLVRWQLADELLRHLEAGGDLDRWLALRPARGGLPPGRLGRRLLDEIAAEVTAVHAAAGAPGPERSSVPIAVDVGGVRIEGELQHRAGRLCDVGVQGDHPSQVVPAWVGLLVATAAAAAGSSTAAAVRGADVVRRGRDEPSVRALAVRAEAAPTALAVAVDLALRARRGPLALLPRTAWRLAGPDADDGAVADDLARDLRAPEALLVHGPLGPEDLLALPAGAAEAGLAGEGPAAVRVAEALVGAFTASVIGGTADAAGDAAGDAA